MTLLLVIIYISFISLGLPDSIFGSAWPSVYQGLGVSISSAGIIFMMVASGTVISSLFSAKLIRKFGTGMVTFISVSMTAVALMGISFADSFLLLCIWAIPLGFGAGSVDVALNNFVALHYEAKHMSWLHCFWGIGASAGPVFMAFAIEKFDSWHLGFRGISSFQLLLSVVLFMSLPLWKKSRKEITEEKETTHETPGLFKIMKLSGFKQTQIAFFCYCAIESTVGLWGSSYLVEARNIAAGTAASWISLFYIGITAGRLLAGFFAIKFTHRQMIYTGQCMLGVGVFILLLPLPEFLLVIGLFLIGLGCAPIYPSMLHETPQKFGSKYSQAVMGIQMATAYTGSIAMPPLFGLLAKFGGYWLMPVYIGILLIIMILMRTKNIKESNCS